MEETKGKRTYRSSRRQEGAERTRRAILAAGRRLFALQGYTATTLAAIAREADVSAPTITAVFGTKASLLEALINEVLGPYSAAASVEDGPLQRSILTQSDSASQIRALAASARRVHERGADVYHIVRGAAAADGDFAAVMHRRQSHLWSTMHAIAQDIADRGDLAPGVTVERATDVFWALCGPEAYRLFVIDRAWSPEEYERWLVETLIKGILHSETRPVGGE